MKKIDNAIVEFYQSQTLDSDKLASLIVETDVTRKKRWFQKVVPLSAVASLLMIMIVGGLYFQNTQALNTINIILQEASINHRSKLQLDFNSQELPVLAKVMNKLDFPLLLPESMRQQFKILGARYCTLNGKLAAHIKLDNGSGEKTVSLFMTQNRKNFSALADQSEDVNGVNVSTWTADGMFYVLASN